MKTFKIQIHSIVDLITNSSTVIFTYSQGSIKAVKELVNEMLKLFNENVTFDDIFYVNIFLNDKYMYEEDENCPIDTDIDLLLDDILTEKIEKPEWMINIENTQDGFGYEYSNSLYLKAKDEKYKELAEKLIKYLYSTHHEACQDG